MFWISKVLNISTKLNFHTLCKLAFCMYYENFSRNAFLKLEKTYKLVAYLGKQWRVCRVYFLLHNFVLAKCMIGQPLMHKAFYTSYKRTIDSIACRNKSKEWIKMNIYNDYLQKEYIFICLVHRKYAKCWYLLMCLKNLVKPGCCPFT